MKFGSYITYTLINKTSSVNGNFSSLSGATFDSNHKSSVSTARGFYFIFEP